MSVIAIYRQLFLTAWNRAPTHSRGNDPRVYLASAHPPGKANSPLRSGSFLVDGRLRAGQCGGPLNCHRGSAGTHRCIGRHNRIYGDCARSSGDALGEPSRADGRDGAGARTHQAPRSRVWRLKRYLCRRWGFAEGSGGQKLDLAIRKIHSIRVGRSKHHRLKNPVRGHG